MPKAKTLYQSPPLMIPRDSKIKIIVLPKRGDNTVGVDFRHEILIRVIRKTTNEAYEYSVPFRVKGILLASLEEQVAGGKTIEFRPVNRGKYHIEVVMPPYEQVSGNPWIEIEVKALICR